MEKKLSVRDLKISFKTTYGKVQAVRNINFDLNKGETLAIVGESGSGKSVTVRAVLGILANNAIVESGQIVYDGKDLLKISEDDFHSIRGDKIAMIFQDPLSSLNPIVKIGKQLTEAMILKNKVNRRNSKKEFSHKIDLLYKYTLKSNNSTGNAEKDTKLLETFKKVELYKATMEIQYNSAVDYAEDSLEKIKDLLIAIPKDAATDVFAKIKSICKRSLKAKDEFVVKDEAVLTKAVEDLKAEIASIKADKNKDFKRLMTPLKSLYEIIEKGLATKKPNFSALAYHMLFVENKIPQYTTIEELDKITEKRYEDELMLDFCKSFAVGVENSYKESFEHKKKTIECLKNNLDALRAAKTPKEYKAVAKVMIESVDKSIDKLLITKDSMAYTFESSLNSTIKEYFFRIKKNAKETERFKKQSAQMAKLKAKGKEATWQVVDPDIADLDQKKAGIERIVLDLIAHYENVVAMDNKHDSNEYIRELAEYLRGKASDIVYKVSKSMAKNKAIKLMEEVGIPEPAKRYTQYPFQFSGGMRQRIVIAIALSANPDILVCDEPTTALDVTIQSQILELINQLKKERDLSVIFITHDLGVVANMADRIAVMYAGKIVEYGTADDVFYHPAHPYTWALLASMPDLDTDEKLDAIPGTPPNMIYPPVGDAFAERNKYALQIDFEEQPPFFKLSETHSAATWLLHPDAPKVEPPKIVTDRIKRSLNK